MGFEEVAKILDTKHQDIDGRHCLRQRRTRLAVDGRELAQQRTNTFEIENDLLPRGGGRDQLHDSVEHDEDISTIVSFCEQHLTGAESTTPTRRSEVATLVLLEASQKSPSWHWGKDNCLTTVNPRPIVDVRSLLPQFINAGTDPLLFSRNRLSHNYLFAGVLPRRVGLEHAGIRTASPTPSQPVAGPV